MAKIGGGSQQQQTKSDPWDGLKPYLIGLDGKTGIMPEAERLYKESAPQYYQGNTYAGLNDTQRALLIRWRPTTALQSRWLAPMPVRLSEIVCWIRQQAITT